MKRRNFSLGLLIAFGNRTRCGHFAFLSSGAIRHVVCVSGSKVIVAVNEEHEAQFFNVDDYGLVGDVNQVLPQLIEAAKKLKAEKYFLSTPDSAIEPG